MNKKATLSLALILGSFGITTQAVLAADTLTLQPGLYQTRVEAGSAKEKPHVGEDCITDEDGKDVVSYFKTQGSEDSCQLTDSNVSGKHFSGQSICKGGGDKPFASMQVKSELNFTAAGYSGALAETGTGTDGKAFTKNVKISAKRTGACKAESP